MNFYRVSTIGKGSFSTVYLIKNNNNGKTYVQKIIKKKYFAYTKNESKILSLLKKIKHKNIVEFIEEIIVEDERSFIFEKLKMNLYNFYKQYPEKIDFNFIIKFTYQISSALEHIHRLFIIHADLKPENIMISNNSSDDLKIIDFGSCIINSNEPISNFYVVSRYFRSPEIVYKEKYNEKIDIWSLGCIIFELFTKHPLFYSQNNNNLKSLFRNFTFKHNILYELKKCQIFYSLDLITQLNIIIFLSKILEFDQKKRYTAKQCLCDNFITSTIIE